MSRQSEHRSLDEVKKLLRSLESTSAADDSETARSVPPPPFPVPNPASASPRTETAVPEPTAPLQGADGSRIRGLFGRTAALGTAAALAAGGLVAFLALWSDPPPLRSLPPVDGSLTVSPLPRITAPAPSVASQSLNFADARLATPEPNTRPAQQHTRAMEQAEKFQIQTAKVPQSDPAPAWQEARQEAQQEARTAQDTPSAVPPAGSPLQSPAMGPRLRVPPALTVTAGEPGRLGIALESVAAASVLVLVVNGPPGTFRLTTGTEIRPGLWTLAASDAGNVEIVMSASKSPIEIDVVLRSAGAEIVAAARTRITSVAPTSPLRAPMSDSAHVNEAEMARHLADGKRLMIAGHIAQAQLLFRRTADAGSGEAARLLGDCFDPAKLFALGVRGTTGDIEKSIYWYERADELGDPHAKSRLLALGRR